MHGYITQNGQVIDESVQMDVHVALTWNQFSKNEDRIIALNNSIQRSTENRKKLRTKIELMYDPIVPKSMIQKTLVQTETLLVNKSEALLTNLNKNQSINFRTFSIIGFQI